MSGKIVDFVKWLTGRDEKRAISRLAEKAGEKEVDRALHEFVDANMELKEAMTELAHALERANTPRRRRRHR